MFDSNLLLYLQNETSTLDHTCLRISC